MGVFGSRTEDGFEEHLNWICENYADHEATVANFKRSVSRQSGMYKEVDMLYTWQCQHQEDLVNFPGCVADLVGQMCMAIESVMVNRVDVFCNVYSCKEACTNLIDRCCQLSSPGQKLSGHEAGGFWKHPVQCLLQSISCPGCCRWPGTA